MNYLMGFGYATIAVAIVAAGSIVLFLVFGLPLLKRMAERASNSLFVPSDASFRVVPEYSLAEARVKQGKYAEAVDEYRQVIAQHPADVYPHLRIAELAVAHLNDVALAEAELLAAVAKAKRRGDGRDCRGAARRFLPVHAPATATRPRSDGATPGEVPGHEAGDVGRGTDCHVARVGCRR